MTDQTTAIVQVSPATNELVISLKNEIQEMATKADGFVVENDEDVKFATDTLSMMAGLKRALEEKRREYIDPLQDHSKAINETFKVLTETLLYADKTTRNKVLAYKAEETRKREEADAITRMEHEAAERKAKLNGTEPPKIPAAIMHTPSDLVNTEGGSSNIMGVWKFEVIDFALLPDEYKKPDTTKIGESVRGSKGTVSIPGVRIFKEETLRVESRK